MKPLALIIRTAGTNCDRELAHAFELAGAATAAVHLNELIADPSRLDSIDLLGFPGGFSYGDDIAAGRIYANRLRHRLDAPLRAAKRTALACHRSQVEPTPPWPTPLLPAAISRACLGRREYFFRQVVPSISLCAAHSA